MDNLVELPTEMMMTEQTAVAFCMSLPAGCIRPLMESNESHTDASVAADAAAAAIHSAVGDGTSILFWAATASGAGSIGGTAYQSRPERVLLEVRVGFRPKVLLRMHPPATAEAPKQQHNKGGAPPDNNRQQQPLASLSGASTSTSTSSKAPVITNFTVRYSLPRDEPSR